MHRARSAAAVALLVLASSADAQTAQLDATGARNSTLVSDSRVGPDVGVNNPIYLPTPGPGGPISGFVNLLFNRGGGAFSACTGTMLSNRKILTAAHCVSDGTSLTSANFFARFRVGTGNTAADWVTLRGSGYSVRDGYTGNVIDGRDVAVLTLDSDAPSWTRKHGITNQTPLQKAAIGGYGLYGRAGFAGVGDDQFTNRARVRQGFNIFETTCNSSLLCATAASSDPAAGPGGVLLADLDRSGRSSNSAICASLGFCNAGFDGFEEVGISFGDSGSGAFAADGSILGVASFGFLTENGEAPFGALFGYACVAFSTVNAECDGNARWVTSQVPEPATFTMTAVGLLGLLGVARRKRVA
jgi:hypothetical protein